MAVANTEYYKEGIREAKRGNTELGLRLLKNALEPDALPEARAWYGYCLVIEEKNFMRGITLGNEARQAKPKSSEICLALGRIYLLANLRELAVRTLQNGLRLDNNQEIYRLLNSIGIRKQPVFKFLHRSSKVNVASGRLLTRFGFR
jgi:tetratricopeptide (TPR) repeat protein